VTSSNFGTLIAEAASIFTFVVVGASVTKDFLVSWLIVSDVAGTSERADCVGTAGIDVTYMSSVSALIVVCTIATAATEACVTFTVVGALVVSARSVDRTKMSVVGALVVVGTCAAVIICDWPSDLTCAVVRADGIEAVGIDIAIVSISSAFIDISANDSISFVSVGTGAVVASLSVGTRGADWCITGVGIIGALIKVVTSATIVGSDGPGKVTDAVVRAVCVDAAGIISITSVGFTGAFININAVWSDHIIGYISRTFFVFVTGRFIFRVFKANVAWTGVRACIVGTAGLDMTVVGQSIVAFVVIMTSSTSIEGDAPSQIAVAGERSDIVDAVGIGGIAIVGLLDTFINISTIAIGIGVTIAASFEFKWKSVSDVA
jgi:hypothetical protein